MQLSLFGDTPQEPAAGSLHLKYSGEATEKHSINAELYARSLLGFDRSFKRTNRFLLGHATNLEVQAEQPSSFKGMLEYALSPQGKNDIAFWLAIMSFFGIDAKSFAKVPMLLFELLIDLIKKAKGKKEQLREHIKKLELDKEATEKLQRLVENNELRRSLDEMTFLLEFAGLEAMEIQQPGLATVTITKKERPYFIAQPEDEVTVESDDKVVSIIYLSPERSKWQFKSGASEFWAEVLDTKFLDKMQDKNLDEIIDLKFSATVEKTTTKEAHTKQIKVSRTISNFTMFSSPTQIPLL
ncbi:DUF7946 domain-containing protein [Desulfovibrio subterraneus]|uniref:DUF7946 domain-containing protein n=1 Tax=Desulfovibrio subterraneus TaxID=2718620 RepID=A0A7J0BGJ7_9BACT|nr:hypothetical protein [Desulfovibrio subterraneus]GFM32321.1 hypothetical protein DSM101010T_06860 [Desulfovibrio subterraneus]